MSTPVDQSSANSSLLLAPGDDGYVTISPEITFLVQIFEAFR